MREPSRVLYPERAYWTPPLRPSNAPLERLPQWVRTRSHSCTVSKNSVIANNLAGTGVPSREVGIEIYGRIDTRHPQPYGQGLVLLLLAAENEARALR